MSTSTLEFIELALYEEPELICDFCQREAKWTLKHPLKKLHFICNVHKEGGEVTLRTYTFVYCSACNSSEYWHPSQFIIEPLD